LASHLTLKKEATKPAASNFLQQHTGGRTPQHRRQNPPHAARPHRARTATAARACRAPAYQEGQAAKRIENPSLRGPIEDTAKRAATLTKKFEDARKKY
jgi:hypothetical protein